MDPRSPGCETSLHRLRDPIGLLGIASIVLLIATRDRVMGLAEEIDR
jgi:hypothetical protein